MACIGWTLLKQINWFAGNHPIFFKNSNNYLNSFEVQNLQLSTGTLAFHRTGW